MSQFLHDGNNKDDANTIAIPRIFSENTKLERNSLIHVEQASFKITVAKIRML